MNLEARRCVFEQTCVVYLIVRPSVGRGLRLEDECILSKLVLFTYL